MVRSLLNAAFSLGTGAATGAGVPHVPPSSLLMQILLTLT